MQNINKNDLVIDPFDEVADFLEISIKEVLKEKKTCVIGFPGGRSVEKTWSKLITRNIEWKKLEFFLVDERVVSITSEESNFLISQKALFDPLLKKKKISIEQVHPFLFEETKSDFGAEDYGKELLLAGGFDIILLSAGEDGHIASLFPNHPQLDSDFPGYLAVYDSPKPPLRRITATMSALLHAKYCCLLFIGESKKEAFDLFNTSENINYIPAVLAKKIKNLKVINSF